MLRYISSCIIVVLLPCSLAAQESRATILGRVADVTGAVIPGANVAVVHEATNTSRRTQTNAEGNFIVPPLDPGRYTITVESAGFKKTVKTGVEVHVGDTLEMNLAWRSVP